MRSQQPKTTATRDRLIVQGWSFLISLVTLWPFWLGLRPDSSKAFMLRDMFVPHSLPENSNNLGINDGAPRALPQDAILALFSPTIPSTMLASALVIGSCLLGCYFAGAMVRDMAGGRLSAQLAAALFVVWNPFVIERFLQGQWTVATAGMLLPAVAYLAAARRHGLLYVAICLCGFVPTGLVLALLTSLVFAPSHGERIRNLVASAIASLPWVLPALWVSNSSETRSDALSAALFSTRGETFLGPLASTMGLSGVWNADAIPPSRTLFSVVVGVVLCVVLLLGFKELWQVYRAVAVLTVLSLVTPPLLATGWGVDLMGFAISHVPGAGMFRDTSKFVCLAIPGFVLLIAVAVERLDPSRTDGKSAKKSAGKFARATWAPRAAAAGLAVACVLTVPAFPTDVAPLKRVQISSTWEQMANIVSGAPNGKIVLLPPGNYRTRHDRPHVDPGLKLLPGSPMDPGFLIVDGKMVDGNPASMKILSDLMSGKNTLQRNGVSWVVVDWYSISDGAAMSKALQVLNSQGIRRVLSADNYDLYRVQSPTLPRSPVQDQAPLFVGMTFYWMLMMWGLCIWLWRSVRQMQVPGRAKTEER
ncbi:hypothetical protein ACN4DU_06870 [Corynebacterium macclintockiae]|uniref:hypothetical protein n=1 Tax=Corynebacterium macclintockiae TaxID=2913501 RepID=UPI003EBCBB25